MTTTTKAIKCCRCASAASLCLTVRGGMLPAPAFYYYCGEHGQAAHDLPGGSGFTWKWRGLDGQKNAILLLDHDHPITFNVRKRGCLKCEVVGPARDDWYLVTSH